MSQSKVTIVRGCSSGFGFIAAKDLARCGHGVYVSMRAVDGKNNDGADALRAFASRSSRELRVLDLEVPSDQLVASAVASVSYSKGQFRR